MKVTIYELLGLMLKRQAPKKIKVLGFTMNYVENAHWGDYEDERTGIRLSDFRLNECLNDEVEILEEEPRDIEVSGSLFTKSEYNRLAHSGEEKKIPEKIIKLYAPYPECEDTRFEEVENKINEIIDYLKSKGE